MAQKEDLYIAMLKYGKAHLTDGVKFSEVREYLESCGYSYEMTHWLWLFSDVFSGVDRINIESDIRNKVPEKETRYFMDIEAYFRLLEHSEFKATNKSSFWATVFAIVAIVISLIGTGFSIHYSREQIRTSISLDQLKELQFDQVELNSKLDEIISNQKRLIDAKTEASK